MQKKSNVNRKNAQAGAHYAAQSRALGIFSIIKKIFLVACVAFVISGCTAIESVTNATKDKSVAMGSDTWGGGAEATAASPEAPMPTGSFWFGRRRVWYVSIKDEPTGQAAAEVVRASNSDIKMDLSPSGANINQGE